jgi:hypothetical protein
MKADWIQRVLLFKADRPDDMVGPLDGIDDSEWLRSD